MDIKYKSFAKARAKGDLYIREDELSFLCKIQRFRKLAKPICSFVFA